MEFKRLSKEIQINIIKFRRALLKKSYKDFNRNISEEEYKKQRDINIKELNKYIEIMNKII